ncbi:MAG: extracellular solute-binding protein [Fuerstia sp.]|nr:extracellular solute-binding protein [Fuerstiella sp.]
MSNDTHISTGFPELDTLLGGNGLPIGTTTLLRGAAGTGKTTLALQLGSYALRSGWSFVFVSAEEDPRNSLNRITRSLLKAGDWHEYLAKAIGLRGTEDLSTQIAALRERVSLFDMTSCWDSHQNCIAIELAHSIRQPRVGFIIHPADDDPLTAAEAVQASGLAEEEIKCTRIGDFLEVFWSQVVANLKGRVFLVVDSLDALIAEGGVRFEEQKERQMLFDICRSFLRCRSICGNDLTVLMTSEDAPGLHSGAAASYQSDVVIELSVVEAMTPVALALDNRNDVKETRLFCRAVKGRGIAIERRPCCYEFVERKGIQFFGTFAARGLLSMFHENAPQREVIEDLKVTDIPFAFQGVQVHEFTRSGLQRQFAIDRQRKKIPKKHSLHLTMIDEYWVNVLRKPDLDGDDLLQEIDADKLRLYSLERTEVKKTQIISALAKAKEHCYVRRNGNGPKKFLAVPMMGNMGVFVYRKDLLRKLWNLDKAEEPKPPDTWEQVEELCGQAKDRNLAPNPLLIETQTYDSLMATALELAWGNGAFLAARIRKNDEHRMSLRFEDRMGRSSDESSRDGFERLVEAMRALQKWAHHDGAIVPALSTVDPVGHPEMDWLFARHWYSTWVDVRTRKDDKGNLVAQTKPEHEFGIARIPVFERYLKDHGNSAPAHHSAWGEWYLAIQKGSENVELGIELINNLMTSRKICQRATEGAALPLVKQFYDDYGDDICPYTDKSFKAVRDMFFNDCRSRANIEGFRRIARVLSGATRAIVTNRYADVRELILNAISELDPHFSKRVGIE